MTSRDGAGPRGLLGVLGGMGPAATAEFYRKLVERTPAVTDRDHIPVIIWADPRTPDRSDAILGAGEDPSPWLRHAARTLAEAGASTIVVPCLTSHHFFRSIAAELDVDFLDMVAATADHIAGTGADVVGLLATTGTVQAGLFQDALAERGIRVVTPGGSQQDRVMTSIRLVKAGRIEDARAILAPAAEALRREGATLIIAGCTEVPLGLPDASLIDPVSIIIDRIVEEFRPTESA